MNRWAVSPVLWTEAQLEASEQLEAVSTWCSEQQYTKLRQPLQIESLPSRVAQSPHSFSWYCLRNQEGVQLPAGIACISAVICRSMAGSVSAAVRSSANLGISK